MRDRRIGASERATVLGLLGNAYEAGVLAVEDYDTRVAGAGTATYASELRAQLAGLPPAYAWEPEPVRPAPPPPASAASGRIALILGIASVPLSFCLVGGVLGVLAVVASRRGGPAPGGPRVTPALIGRIFGIVGIALSLAALTAVLFLRR